MTSRSLFLYLPLALAGLGAGVICVLWVATENSSPHVTVARESAETSAAPSATPEVNQTLELRLADRIGRSEIAAEKPKPKTQSLQDYVAQKHAEKKQQASPDAAPTSPRTPLNLKLPTGESDTLASIDSDAPAKVEVPNGAGLPPDEGLDFDSQPAITPEAVGSDLFNPTNGLRGFMKQGWVNQRFGVQGGLALNDKRITPDDNSLRDDLAVGMGVIFSF